MKKLYIFRHLTFASLLVIVTHTQVFSNVISAAHPATSPASNPIYYGEIYVSGGTGNQVLATAGTWYKLTGFNANGDTNGMTADHTTDKITVNNTGYYSIQLSGNVLISSTFNFRIAIYVNGVAVPEATQQAYVNSATDKCQISINAISLINAGQNVEVYAVCTTGNNKNIRMEYVTLTVTSVSFDETDPIYSGSPASGIGASDITNWNTAYSWGNHATAGYLTSFSESDPQVGSATNNIVPKWNGSALVDGIIYDNGTQVGIGTTTPTSTLDVNGTATFDNLALQNSIDLPVSSGTDGIITQNGVRLLNTWKGGTIASSLYIGNGTDVAGNLTGTGIGANLAIGGLNLVSSSTGNQNVALGRRALESLTTGGSNVAVGTQTLISITSSIYNVGIGNNVLEDQTSGTRNTSVGASSGNWVTTGSYNTFLGESAGNGGLSINSVVTGSQNTFIGAGTDVSDNTISGTIALGYNVLATGSNRLFIDNSNTSSPLIVGDFANDTVKINGGLNVRDNVGIGTSLPTEKLVVDNGTSIGTYTTSGWMHSSDARKKTNVVAMENELDNINALRPVRFDWKQGGGKTQIGFIAQEVEKIYPEAVLVDANGNYSLAIQNLVAPLVSAVQILSQQVETIEAPVIEKDAVIDSLQQQIADQQKQITDLYAKMDAMLTQMSAFENALTQCCTQYVPESKESGIQSGSDIPKLEQNIPNPFIQSTYIQYYLPESVKSAKIIVSDMQGVMLLQFTDLQKGFGTIEIKTSTLSSGNYYYSLFADNKLVDTKQMVLSK